MRVNPAADTDETVYLAPSRESVVPLSEVGGKPILETPVLWPQDLTLSHGINITADLLRGMATDYSLAIEQATLNRDHAWAGPTLGLCTRVWMVGEELWARYEDLDPILVAEIRERRWTRRSAEFVLRHPATDRPYYTGLALLGQQRPGLTRQPPLTVTLRRTVVQQQLGAPAPLEVPMSNAPADSPAAPAAPADTPTAPAAPDPNTLALAAAQRAEQLATQANARLVEAEAKLAAAQRKAAELDARTQLDALGGRLTPAMRKLAEPLLVELSSAPTASTVKLVAAGAAAGAAPVDVPVAQRVLEILGAVPDQGVLGRPRQAEQDAPAPGDAAFAALAGLKPERLAEPDQKYNVLDGWGFQVPSGGQN